MPQKSEIRSVAERWIAKYDGDALTQAQMRIEELQSHGATEAYRLWLEIYNEAQALMQRKDRRH